MQRSRKLDTYEPTLPKPPYPLVPEPLEELELFPVDDLLAGQEGGIIPTALYWNDEYASVPLPLMPETFHCEQSSFKEKHL